MKTVRNFVTAFLVAIVLAACGTTKEQRCETYLSAYELYQASLSAGREPSKDEVTAAKAAATFLTIYCGWSRTRGVDVNGVPELAPPAP